MILVRNLFKLFALHANTQFILKYLPKHFVLGELFPLILAPTGVWATLLPTWGRTDNRSPPGDIKNKAR